MCKISHFSVTNQENPEKILLQRVIDLPMEAHMNSLILSSFGGLTILCEEERLFTGNPSFYFRCAPTFEAPADSKYGWLNNSLFLCAPSFSQGFNGIVLNVWKVN